MELYLRYFFFRIKRLKQIFLKFSSGESIYHEARYTYKTEILRESGGMSVYIRKSKIMFYF